MGHSKPPQDIRPEEIIAAFDRECQAARELSRRHTEHVRTSRADDRQIQVERRQRPRPADA